MSGFYRDGQWVDTSETPWGESMTPNVDPKEAQIASLKQQIAEQKRDYELLKETLNSSLFEMENKITELEARIDRKSVCRERV